VSTINGKDEALVYFIQAEHGGPIKIGIAADPHERLRELQVGSPYRLVIRMTRRGGVAAERRYQRQFKAHRLSGEWFAPSDALVKLCRGLPGDDATIAEAEARGFERGFEEGLREVDRFKTRIEGLQVEHELLDYDNAWLEWLVDRLEAERGEPLDTDALLAEFEGREVDPRAGERRLRQLEEEYGWMDHS
jgi:hypothetical protein